MTGKEVRYCVHFVQAFGFLIGSSVSLADITEVERLNFGTIAVTNNDSQGYVQILHTGAISASQNVVVIQTPQVGAFFFSSFPANQRLNVSAAPIQSTSQSTQYSSEQFRLSTIDVPTTLDTNGNGEARLQVGGRLTTSGSGNNRYIDTDYRIRYQITIDY